MAGGRAPARTALLAVLPFALVLVAGCAGGGAPRAPEGLGASVLQYRFDQTSRRIQIKVANDGPTAVTVTSARLVSPFFAGEAVWPAAGDEQVRIGPGERTDLPAALPRARCPEGAGTARIRVEVRTGDQDGDQNGGRDGGEGRAVAEVPAADPYGVLARVHRDDCFREEVAGVARLELAGPLRRARDGDRLVGHMTLRVTAAGGPGTLSVDSIRPTTLLQPAAGEEWRPGLRVTAGEDVREADLAIVPARCDPHAVAEDKLGTVLPVTVRLVPGGTGPERAGTVAVPSPPDLKQAIYEYVVAACR